MIFRMILLSILFFLLGCASTKGNFLIELDMKVDPSYSPKCFTQYATAYDKEKDQYIIIGQGIWGSIDCASIEIEEMIKEAKKRSPNR